MPALPRSVTPRDVAAFDHLSGTLSASYRQLERRLNSLQQELIAQRPLAALGEMTAGLAHQVRTPLATALVYACHLRDAQLAPADQARFADRLVDRLRQLERLVADMLAYARGDGAGTQCFSFADLMHAVAAAVEPRRPSAVSLRLPSIDTPIGLNGSLENLAGAFANLCLNAFEAGALAVSIQRLRSAPTQLKLAICDDGPGICPAARERVFEPFVSGRPGGTGLGLAVARGVVERHGGVLTLADTSLGCRFEIVLPCRQAALALLEA